MKIRQIETYPLYYPLSEPYGDANGYKYYRSCFMFRIITDSGIDGWGECVDWLPALETGFQNRIIPYLLGKPVNQRLELTEKVGKWQARIGAGVSMALTEIMAKAAGLSITDLWGGARRKRIPVYASFQSYTPRTDWMQVSLKRVEHAAGQGFRQVKVKIGGKTFAEDREHIALLQDRLNGQLQIAVDANQSYDAKTALKWNRVFKDTDNWLWFEEPMPLQSPEDYGWLRQQCLIPVAGGENLPSPEVFSTWMKTRALDLIQPDAMHMKGIDPFRGILAMARYQGVRISPHAYDGILSRLYAILAQACLPPWSKMDGDGIEPLEWDVMENPFTSLFHLPVKNGEVTIPSGIGLGTEIDWQRLESLRWDGTAYV